MEETELYYVQLDKYAIDEGVPVQKSLSSCSNGRSRGINGVTYENIKNSWEEYGEDIVRLFNIILTNKKCPISWKHAIIDT